jgi:hypothetical protein
VKIGARGLAEVNHPVLRSLRAGEIAEAARARLAAVLASHSGETWDERVQAVAKRKFDSLTRPDRPRPTGFRPASAQLERVAELYLQAVAAGGDNGAGHDIHVTNPAAVLSTIDTVWPDFRRSRARAGLIDWIAAGQGHDGRPECDVV